MQSCSNLYGTVIFRFLRASTGARRILTFVTAILGVLSLIAPSWAEPTTVSLTTAGTLKVDRTGNLTADLADGLPSSGFFDVYQGTFSASATNFPAIPVTQAYANALFGTITVDNTSFSFDGNNLPTTSASLSNELVIDAEAFASSPSGAFFPALLPNTFYTYDASGNITIASQTDLATILPDIGPLTVLFTSGTYDINIPELTLVSTPIPTAVPEPASLVLLGVSLLGFGVMRRRQHSA
jgi:hypothetical protein